MLLPTETWVDRQGTQCIGFSDGGYRFGTDSTALESLFSDIARQNIEVAGSGLPLYTVVVAAPLTGTGSSGQGYSPGTLGQGGVNELRGAMLAQAAWNSAAVQENQATGTKKPVIRLLVANVGWQSGYADVVARQIDRAARQDHRLVGVLGFFQSVGPAEKAVEFLNDTTRIPIVSSTASDDILTAPDSAGKRRYPWYFRVGPTNREEAQAIADAVADRKISEVSTDAPLRPLIVEGAVENYQDNYSDNLAQDVGDELRKRDLVDRKPAVIPFPGSADGVTATAGSHGGSEEDQLIQALKRQCEQELPNLLIYTGRTTNVNILLDALYALDQSDCGQHNPTMPIIAGDDAMELETDDTEIGTNRAGRHPFYFADFGLSRIKEIPPDYLKNPLTQKRGEIYLPEKWKEIYDNNPGLISGHVMLAFDATSVLTRKLADALINSSADLSDDQGSQKLRDNLRTVLNGTCIPGASGYVSFNGFGGGANRLIMIRKLDFTDWSFPSVTDFPGTAPAFTGCRKGG
ncbi:hypothetical protein [Frankia sp. Cppng1_Ct_nod]|uniref:hypothetical protein n=1 Tax=Frankia sp. Cppng1_Ct_nod TaxID=2897162 RepID=UPI001040EC14|nr:hypothetical protein [Frankia sp. Cppng1_Ct_nod]